MRILFLLLMSSLAFAHPPELGSNILTMPDGKQIDVSKSGNVLGAQSVPVVPDNLLMPRAGQPGMNLGDNTLIMPDGRQINVNGLGGAQEVLRNDVKLYESIEELKNMTRNEVVVKTPQNIQKENPLMYVGDGEYPEHFPSRRKHR